MAQKNMETMKSSSALLVIRVMQIKATTTKYHFMPISNGHKLKILLGHYQVLEGNNVRLIRV